MRRLLLAVALVAGAPGAADAFCGFYVSGAGADLFNNATQVVLMRAGTRTVLSMQNNYQGPAENFAMVVPVPVVLQEENVKTLPLEIFAKIDTLAAPRLDDPLGRELRRHIAQRKMRRDEDDAQLPGREHHGDGHVAGEVGQELGDAGVAVACRVERLFVDRSGHDRVHGACQRESRRLFDRLTGNAARLLRGEPRSVLRTSEERDVGRERGGHGQRLVHHLRPDPPRIAQGDGEAGTGGRTGDHGARAGYRCTSAGAAGRCSAEWRDRY